MKNPYKPYQHTDGQWYPSRRKKFFRSFASSSRTECLLRCNTMWATDAQEIIDKCDKFAKENDPEWHHSDPAGYRA